MESVIFDGVTYTKASILAKHFHYTTDYIGQLARADKVDARLVGRSWYVAEQSLLHHKDARYKDTRVAEKRLENIPISSSRHHEEVRLVVPRISKNVVKQVTAAAAAPVVAAVAVRYLPDDEALLPQPVLSKKTPLPVTLASAQKVKVIEPVLPVRTLEFTPLPEVSLQGTLTVTELHDEMETMTSEPLTVLPPVVSATESVAPTLQPAPVIQETRQAAGAVLAAAVSFTPQAVSAQGGSATASGRFLLWGAFVTSVALAAFFMTATDHFFVAKNLSVYEVALSARAISSLWLVP